MGDDGSTGGTAGDGAGRDPGWGPGAIRLGALAWCTQAAEWSLLADELRAAAPADFAGDEADAYRTWLTDGWADHLDGAAEASGLVGRALGRYADDLDAAQQRLRGLGGGRDGGDGTLGSPSRSGDAAIDPWTVAAADRALADHADAVARCRAAIDGARALRPARIDEPRSMRLAGASGPPIAAWEMTAAGGHRSNPAAACRLTSLAGGLRTVSGLSAMAWSAILTVPGSAVTVRPADDGCGGAPPSTDPTTPVAPSPTSTTSQWPALLGLPPNTPDLPIYDSTTTAPSAPAVAPEPTTAPAVPSMPSPTGPAGGTGAPLATAAEPAEPATGSPVTAAPNAPSSGQSTSMTQGCAQGDEGYIAKLPRGGPFPFEPKRGQRFSQPQNISREDGNPVDKYGQVWEWKPDQNKGRGEWDVQNGPGHTNIDRNGRITHGPNNTGRNPKPEPDSAESSNWLDDLLGGVFTVHLDPNEAAKVAALTALVGGAVYIVGGALAGG